MAAAADAEVVADVAAELRFAKNPMAANSPCTAC
jgi:hypothetical protein